MRIVRHPNIVELKAFFYNNGDRVRPAPHPPPPPLLWGPRYPQKDQV